jgi:UDP-N-acetylmuramate--alanine ligase
MAGVAFLLKRRGHDVTGCDKYASPRTRWLEANGIPVALGHSPAHLAGIDELVVTPAVPQSDPELSAAKGLSPQPPKGLSPQIRIRYRGEVLAELVNASDGIAVCGTHGKTTTATFTARLLHALGTDPSWCIGGETGDMPVACEGTGPIVVEADESDGTLALYRAHTLVITSIDFDHPEHFKSVEDYRACYDTAAEAATDVIRAWELDPSDWPELEHLVVGRHNVMNARAAIEVALRRGYSREAISASLSTALSALPDRRFERIWPPKSLKYNPQSSILNPQSSILNPQSSILNLQSSITVFTDYAHHPAELKCAVGMAAELKPIRLRVLFQPHRYSRTKALLNEFPPAFAEADEVVLIPVYPAFEEPIPGGDIADLYAAFRECHSKLPEPPIREGRNLLRPQREGRAPARPIILARNAEEAWKHVLLSAAPGDLILLAGAGDIINLVPRIQRDLSSNPSSSILNPQSSILNPQSSILNPQSSILNLQSLSFFHTGGATVGGGERTIVGMGSNTWFSDCVTDIEIVRAPAAEPNHPHSKGIPAGVPGASLLADHPELAFMAGIPGTVGGWTKMNAGAFGDSFGNYVDHVVADGKIIPHDACGFGYRTSAIEGLITAVWLADLNNTKGINDVKAPKNLKDLKDLKTAKDYLARRKKFPPRTCGSVFKNPSPDVPAGRLLDEAGAKSMRVGGAYVWSEHANVIVAGEGCTSSDILALARLMAHAVFFRSGIRLEPEIRGLEV